MVAKKVERQQELKPEESSCVLMPRFEVPKVGDAATKANNASASSSSYVPNAQKKTPSLTQGQQTMKERMCIMFRGFSHL